MDPISREIAPSGNKGTVIVAVFSFCYSHATCTAEHSRCHIRRHVQVMPDVGSGSIPVCMSSTVLPRVWLCRHSRRYMPDLIEVRCGVTRCQRPCLHPLCVRNHRENMRATAWPLRVSPYVSKDHSGTGELNTAHLLFLHVCCFCTGPHICTAQV